jgi:hypothetical protein
MAAAELGDPGLVGIQPAHVELPCQGDRQRQTDIAETDDDDVEILHFGHCYPTRSHARTGCSREP